MSHCLSWDEESPGVCVPSSPPSQKTKMNSEGAVPGSFNGSVPRPCKLMVKKRNTLFPKVARTGWHSPLGLHSTGWRVKERWGSRLGPRPWQAEAGPQTGVEVGKWAEHIVSPEGQVLGGPVFTHVALKGFPELTRLLKTHKRSHAESRFSPLFLDRHFPGLKRIYKAGCRHSTRLRTPPQ